MQLLREIEKELARMKKAIEDHNARTESFYASHSRTDKIGRE